MFLALAVLIPAAALPSAVASGSDYAAPGSCAACHWETAATYRQVSMAQSAQRFGREVVIEDFRHNNTFFHALSNRHYRVTERNGRYFQRRWLVDEQGREAHVFERQITHFIGSGRHARSYLYLAPSGELTQLPLTWYQQERRWGMSPGYDSPRHYDFSRTVDFGCLFCHAAYPSLPEGADAFGRRSLWKGDLPGPIDCQRCHGPGSRHMELAEARSPAAQVRAAIVNPKRLTRSLQMDVCLQCHLQTTSEPLPHALRRFGRPVFSYRPGEPLSAYVVHFNYASTAGRDDNFEINGHGHRLLQSACYTKSGGKLACTTCHNPHHSERGDAARANHNRQCASCHKPHPESNRSDCVGCHMPRRRTEDAVHVVMTDHKIQRRPAAMLDSPLTERHEPYRGPLVLTHNRELSVSDRRLYLAAAQCQGQRVGCETLIGAPGLEARLLAARATGSTRIFREILDAAPAHASVRAEHAALLEGRTRRTAALKEFRKAAASMDDPPSAHLGIARLLIASGNSKEAMEQLRQAASSATTRAEALNNLGNLLVSLNRVEEGRREIESSLAFEPDFAEALNNLARVQAMQGELEAALVSARRAVEIDPGYAEGHYNLARLRHESGDREAAMRGYRRALDLNPKLAAAHFSLGVAQAEANEFATARRSFEETLRLDPAHEGARENLKRIEGRP